MRKWWKRSVAISLGLMAGTAKAADPVPAAQLERPIIATAGPRPAAVSLDRPEPIASESQAARPAVFDPSLRPIAYSNEAESPSLVIRGQAPDSTGPKPMPPGPADPATTTVAPTPQAPPTGFWRRHPNTPQAVGAPSQPIALTAGGPVLVASAGQPLVAADPTPTTTVPVTPAPAIAGPVWSMLHGNCDGDSTCGLDGCDACGCTFNDRFYANGEYLLWWIKGSKTPPLVTQGSAGDPIPGALGLPGTTVLFGGGSVEDNPFSGGRLMVGYWFGDQHLLGIELGGFLLAQQGQNFSDTSFGSPILARPFINAATGTETTELVAGPGVLAGTVSVTTRSQLWGYESNLRSNLCAGQVCGVDYFVDGILGFRGLGLDESLDIRESLVVIGGTSAGQQFGIEDRFATQNRFYGGQVGALSEFRWGRWVLDVNGKVALGPTEQMVRINGSTAITPLGGATQAFNGGLLALPSNSGRFSRDTFTWVPEMGLNLGYQCTDHIKLFVGYNVLYWSSVVRAGEQIDRTVNTNQLPPSVAGGPARPQFSFNTSDFWAQGVTFGVEFKY